jgi:nucleoid DNA-binding protein
MTKADIVNRVAAATGVTKLETEILVDGFFKTIAEGLAEGEHFEIRGFGTFKVRKRNAREARNPRTGSKVSVSAAYIPTFKPSRELRTMISEKLLSSKKTRKID